MKHLLSLAFVYAAFLKQGASLTEFIMSPAVMPAHSNTLDYLEMTQDLFTSLLNPDQFTLFGTN